MLSLEWEQFSIPYFFASIASRNEGSLPFQFNLTIVFYSWQFSILLLAIILFLLRHVIMHSREAIPYAALARMLQGGIAGVSYKKINV